MTLEGLDAAAANRRMPRPPTVREAAAGRRGTCPQCHGSGSFWTGSRDCGAVQLRCPCDSGDAVPCGWTLMSAGTVVGIIAGGLFLLL